MLNIFLMKVTAEQFFKDAFSISPFGPSWIHNCYRQFIEFFRIVVQLQIINLS